MATSDAADVAHSFAYVRWNQKERNIRLFTDGTVSYDRKAAHGYWEYRWDATERRGVFAIHFNARPERAAKRHEFTHIGDTDAYRYIAPIADWTAIIVTDLKTLFVERGPSHSESQSSIDER